MKKDENQLFLLVNLNQIRKCINQMNYERWVTDKKCIISLKGYGHKINFLLFKRTFKVMNEDPLQTFRTLLGFRNISGPKPVCSPPSW